MYFDVTAVPTERLREITDCVFVRVIEERRKSRDAGAAFIRSRVGVLPRVLDERVAGVVGGSKQTVRVD